MITENERDLRRVLPIVILAAEREILPRWGKVVEEIKSQVGGYKDTVTEADREASKFILDRVRRGFPGSYSEEQPYIEDPDRWTKKRIWHFDPVDGTAEFCAKMPSGFAVNASLLEKQSGENYLPVAGIIYRPGDRTLAYNDGRKTVVTRDGKDVRLNLRDRGAIRGWVRKVDPSVKLERFYRALCYKKWISGKGVPSGGAGASIIDLLEGKINLIVYNYNLTREWDWSAAVPIVKSLGGFACDLNGNEIENFNRRPMADKSEYDLNGMVISIAFKKDEIIPNIPRDLLENRLQ